MFDPLFTPIFCPIVARRGWWDFVGQFHLSIFATFGGASLISTTTSTKSHIERGGSDDWATFERHLVCLPRRLVGQSVWYSGKVVG